MACSLGPRKALQNHQDDKVWRRQAPHTDPRVAALAKRSPCLWTAHA